MLFWIFYKVNHLKWLVICGYLMLLAGCKKDVEQANLFPGKVTRVLSGQTIEVVLADTSEVSQVRITGIDAPDLRQDPWGKAARDKLIELVMGLPIDLETDLPLQKNLNRDRYNRINAHVWQDKTLVSQQLVQTGCVLANTKYPHSYSKLLINAQEYARLMGYGIWNRDRAMRQTPNQFRSQIKK